MGPTRRDNTLVKQRWRELSKGEKAAVVVAGVGIILLAVGYNWLVIASRF